MAINTSRYSNLNWAKDVVQDFRDARESLTNLAINLSDPDLSDAAFDTAEVLDKVAYQIESILKGGGSKKSKSKRIAEFRRMYNDDVLSALEDTYMPYFA